MIFGKQQAEEIKTIKGRNITLQLSDADCDRLLGMVGEHGLTVTELLQKRFALGFPDLFHWNKSSFL